MVQGGGGPNFHTSLTSSCSCFSSADLLSDQSRNKSVSRIRKMKSLRPAPEEVRQIAAVLVPLVEVSGEVHLLYTRRSLGMSSHSGQVSFPGGKEDPGDVDLTRTALRETEEELGIPAEEIDVWHQMPKLSSNQKGDYVVEPVVGVIRNYQNLQLKPSRGEVSSVFTVPIRTLVNPDNHGYTQFRIAGGSSGYSLPVFHLQVPYVIWGLTAIITFQLLRALLPGTAYSHKISFQKPIISSGSTQKY